MKKALCVATLLCLLVCAVGGALAETAPKDTVLQFQGKDVAVRPIAYTTNDVGEHVLILYIQGLDDFVRSQRYSVTAPIYACIVDEDSKPLNPNRIVWNYEITDTCFFFYSNETMPETLSLVPLDKVDDPSTWGKLTLAELPSEVPEGYMLEAKDWNNTGD